MTTTRKPRTTAPAPPAGAAAADPHWAAKLERLRQRTRPAAKVTICDDDEVKDAHHTAQQVLARATLRATADPDDAEAQQNLATATGRAERAQAAFDEAAIVLTFQALPRDEFTDLVAAHPPTEPQGEEGYDFNPDTLGPVLGERSSLDGLTADDIRGFLTTWGDGEADTLRNAIFAVQRVSRLDVGKG